MTHSGTLPRVAGALALATLVVRPAFASETQAGSKITNTVTVNYQVGGVAQTATQASDTLTVDRKINLLVEEVGTVTTTVTPGQTAAVTTFKLTNLSNATLDFALTAAQLAGGTAAHGGTDSFDVSNIKIYADSNANGTYDPGTDTLVTYVDELAAEGSRTLFVVADVPLSLANASVAGVTLTGEAREAGAAGTLGAALTETTGANTAAMDTVFADAAGVTDGARDARHSDNDDYTVFTATLSVLKSSSIISDPINGTTNPKFIPGATIQYCIAVTNAAGGADATNVAVTDTLPTQITYDAGYGIKLSGTVVSGQCQLNGTAGGSFASGTVSGTLPTVTAGDTRTLVFRATIN
ncbi:MAG: DUF11 domain-containing protein [Sphingomonas sp.]|uniref:hypothetical protein n=1 Tax=Sphingomonas sp. TaxID=28214 RepID=UPI001B0F6FB5|nr:hypothetical protein [Sphingomonas sp.]MBO9623856.1 DUF11 domain-containing protein [Sphingomonas sp.]